MFNEDIKNSLDTVMEMVETAIIRADIIFHKNQLDDTPEGLAFFDAACMNLFVIGETLKELDNKTNGKYLVKYPNIPWKDVIKTRDIIAHHYTGLKKDIIHKYLSSEFEEDKNNCTENIWNEAEKRMKKERVDESWIKDTHSEILRLINGIERNQSNGLKP